VFAAGAGSGVAGSLLALAVLLPATAVAEEPARKDVLLLYADSMLLPANVVADRELRSALGVDAATPVRFYTEALDLSWFPDQEVERAMLDLLRAKAARSERDVAGSGRPDQGRPHSATRGRRPMTSMTVTRI
jgi:hypothetical protein